MIKTKTAINFLKHIYSESATDLANISVAEAEDNYDTILRYLAGVQSACDKWMLDLRKEKGEKK